jgi:hypothetical protein
MRLGGNAATGLRSTQLVVRLPGLSFYFIIQNKNKRHSLPSDPALRAAKPDPTPWGVPQGH